MPLIFGPTKRGAVQAQEYIGKEIDMIKKVVQLDLLTLVPTQMRSTDHEIRFRLNRKTDTVPLAQSQFCCKTREDPLSQFG